MKKLLCAYLRAHVIYGFLLAVCMGIYGLMLFLYRMPLEGALYATLLCLLVGVALFAVRFRRFCRQMEALDALEREAALPLERLPEPLGLLEARYQTLLENEVRRNRAAAARQEHDRQEMADYYSLWAHQVKTPISAMKLLLQGEDSDVSRALQVQLLATEQYVDMVMAYVRVTADTTDFLIRPCAVEALVRQTVRRFAPLFIRKELHLELGPLEGQVLTDEKWVGFALEQVLSNAVKYTPAGGTITVEVQNGLLTVTDTGVGIAPEDLPRVFEKGSRAATAGRINGRRGLDCI